MKLKFYTDKTCDYPNTSINGDFATISFNIDTELNNFSSNIIKRRLHDALLYSQRKKINISLKLLQISKNVCVEQIDDRLELLFVYTKSNKLYVHEKFLHDKSYNRLKNLLLKFKIYDEIVFLNDVSKYSFLKVEVPKLKSISDRKEFVNKLISDFYAEKDKK